MRYNNRMPVYRRKKFDIPEPFHREIKDGKSVFVKGLKPNPYKDVDFESLKLKSRIDTGVFESHEGAARKLEKVNGSDVMTVAIEQEQSKQKAAKESAERRHYAQEIFDKVFNEKKVVD